MTFARKFLGALTAAALAFATLFAAATPAQAYATGSTNISGTTSNTFTTPASGVSTSVSTSQWMSFSNPLGGIFEVTSPTSTSTTLNINAFVNGAMDTSFNSTGSVSITAQYGPNTRDYLNFTTYANGTKWALLENSWSSSGYNYLHLGTVAGGYQSTITLPTRTSNTSTCATKLAAVSSAHTSYYSGIDLVPNTGFSAPLLSLNCTTYLNANGISYASDVRWLVNYSGGTVLGTPASYTAFGSGPAAPQSLMDSSTKKVIVNFGVSVNPNATGSQIALTYFDAMIATVPSTAPTVYGVDAWTDFVVTRVSADGTSITQTAAAWTGQNANGRTGRLIVVPRNSGTVYALQHATDGTNVVSRVLTFGSSGAATSQTATTGASFAPGFTRTAVIGSQGTTLKFASLDSAGNTSYFTQVNATTAVATQVATFTLAGGFSYDSFMWQMADNSNGADFYSRTSSTSVIRVAASTAPTAPSAPSAPTVVVGNNQATVSWSAPASNGSPITAYTVDYSSNSGTNWTTWANNISTTSTTVTGLTNGTAYIFRVSATNSVGTSSSSSSSSSATPNPTPSAPTGLTVSGNGSNSVTLSWTAPTNLNSLTDYVIQYSTDGGTTWTTYVDGVSTATTATVSGLTTGSSYSFRVSGSNSIGAGSSSTATTSITAATVPANVASAPTLVAQPGEIIVTWTTPANGGSALTSALLQYSNNGTVWTDYTGTVDLSGTITMTGLTAGLSYYTRVKAANFFGPGSAWSSASTAVTALPATAPGTVTNVVANTGSSGGSVTLTWTSPAANGSAITDYTIQYSSDGGVTWTTWTHSASSSTSANITGLTPGANYSFKVTAVNGVGSSTPTAATTPVAAAAQPAPQAAPAPEQVKLPTNIQVNKKVDVAAGKVVIGGENMQDVKTVLMNNIESTILDRTAQNITVSIPKQVIGWVDVEFITSTGKLRFESLIYVENVKANQLAKLRLGFAPDKSLTSASSKRFTTLSAKFKSAATATCIGYYGGKVTKAIAITHAKTACELVAGSSRSVVVREAVTKELIHAHVLVLFDY